MEYVMIVFFLLFGASISPSKAQNINHVSYTDQYMIHDVIYNGAIGDGMIDDTSAFRAAWIGACSSTVPSTMRIPSGKSFLLNSITFNGPCQSNNVNVQIDGHILAPMDFSKWACEDGGDCTSWIGFSEVNGLSIHGSGTIDGQGLPWWSRRKEEQALKQTRRRAPTGLTIGNCNNVHLGGLNFKNSPQMHIAIEFSTMVGISELSIDAPGDSPNTDGIHIGGSQYVNIDNCRIGTGDDCISIGPGSSNINISSVTCGPGHGISVGSLGMGGEDDQVERVYVRNSRFFGTSNGVRIKTWQGGRGFARNMVFEQIKMNDVVHPIMIDQFYCDSPHTCPTQASAVHVSGITYSGIYGTSSNEVGVTLDCSKTVPCTDIFIDNIGIRSNRESLNTSSYCSSAYGISSGQMIPSVPCLSYQEMKG